MKYDLVLVLRKMSQPNLVACMKRVANHLWDNNGVLRKIEFLGLQDLPVKVRSSVPGKPFKVGNYFIYHVEIGPQKLKRLRDTFKLDVDIVREQFYMKEENKVPEDYECTLNEELLPPSLRPSVKPLLEYKNVVT